MTDLDDPTRTDRPTTDVTPPALVSLVSLISFGDDGIDGDGEVTFVPRSADGDDLLTTWLTADRRTVVTLEDWR
jgi:hypothetical protein